MLLDGERREPISSQYQIIVSKQHCTLIQIPVLLAHFAYSQKKRFLRRFWYRLWDHPSYLEQQVYAKTYLCSRIAG